MQNLLDEYGGTIVAIILLSGIVMGLYQLFDIFSSGLG